jgi:two-component system, cell cycle response regulator
LGAEARTLSSNDDDRTITDPGATQSLGSIKRQSESVRLFTVYVIAGPEPAKYHSVYPNERAIIGRDENAELTLHDVRISRHHAALGCSSDGSALTLEDLGSLNGTYLNGVRVQGSIPVRHGDELKIGDVTLRVDRMGLEQLSHLARQIERIRMATSDPLTSLGGRQQLDDTLPAKIKRRHQGGIPVSLIFLDIDHFKQINDTFGHMLGDEVLRVVARSILQCIREVDVAVRYGGDEILVFLLHCDETGAFSIAQRLHQRVDNYDWSQHTGRATGQPPLAVHISAGVAQYTGQSIEDWIQDADKALYEAKRRGRAQTVRKSELTPT